jgi:copper chaperone CopZ
MGKNYQISIIVFFVAFFIISSCGRSGEKSSGGDSKMEPSVVEISIIGMTCTGCEQTIKTNISKLNGIKSVKTSFTLGNAIVEFFPDKVDTIKLKERVIGAGYSVKKVNLIPAP